MSKRRMKLMRSRHVSHREMPADELQQNPNESTRTPRNRGSPPDVAGFCFNHRDTQGPTNPFAPPETPKVEESERRPVREADAGVSRLTHNVPPGNVSEAGAGSAPQGPGNSPRWRAVNATTADASRPTQLRDTKAIPSAAGVAPPAGIGRNPSPNPRTTPK